MAGSMSKQNQRQSQKRKQTSKKYGLKRIRMHEIPLFCTCGNIRIVSSIDAYKPGGNHCRTCGKKMAFNVKAFPKVQVAKV